MLLNYYEATSKKNAESLSKRIEDYWHKEGHPQVKIWPVSENALGFGEIWVVRSNLVRGMPPDGSAEKLSSKRL